MQKWNVDKYKHNFEVWHILGDDFDSLHDDIKNSVNSDNLNDIDRVSEAVVKEALGKLKAGKSDALFDFSSDWLINGPPYLSSLISLKC